MASDEIPQLSADHSMRKTFTHKNATPEVQEAMEAVGALGKANEFRIRQIECRCPADYKFCECQDKLFNRRGD